MDFANHAQEAERMTGTPHSPPKIVQQPISDWEPPISIYLVESGQRPPLAAAAPAHRTPSPRVGSAAQWHAGRDPTTRGQGSG